jgi:hypothetical protein
MSTATQQRLRKKRDLPPVVPLIYDVEQICAAVNKGKTGVYEDIASGKLKTFKDGKSRRATAENVERYARLLAGE